MITLYITYTPYTPILHPFLAVLKVKFYFLFSIFYNVHDIRGNKVIIIFIFYKSGCLIVDLLQKETEEKRKMQKHTVRISANRLSLSCFDDTLDDKK